MLKSESLSGTMTVRALKLFNGMDGKPVEFGPKSKPITVPKSMGVELIANGLAEEVAPAAAPAAAPGGSNETK